MKKSFIFLVTTHHIKNHYYYEINIVTHSSSSISYLFHLNFVPSYRSRKISPILDPKVFAPFSGTVKYATLFAFLYQPFLCFYYKRPHSFYFLTDSITSINTCLSYSFTARLCFVISGQSHRLRLVTVYWVIVLFFFLPLYCLFGLVIDLILFGFCMLRNVSFCLGAHGCSL